MRLAKGEQRVLRLTIEVEISAATGPADPRSITTYEADVGELGRKVVMTTRIGGRPAEFAVYLEPVRDAGVPEGTWRLAAFDPPRYTDASG